MVLTERSEVAVRVAKSEVVYKTTNGAKVRSVKCSYCGEYAPASIVPHLKQVHPEVWEQCVEVFHQRRSAGWSFKKIMWEFERLFSWSVIAHELGDASGDVPMKDSIKRLEPTPEEFTPPTTSRWSFETRGAWANHDSKYRGNWAPQVPRALILRYSKEGDLVADPFIGGGTTAIECLLLGRHFIGTDISPTAVKVTNAKVSQLRKHFTQYLPGLLVRPGDVQTDVREGDARDLRFIPSGSVQLACVHPPYLDTIEYTKRTNTDFSTIYDAHRFCQEFQKVALEVMRTLRPGGYCAVLIADVRREGRVIPLGFMLLSLFMRNGFALRETLVKDQHQCGMSEFWSKKGKFIRIAHEHVFVFQKPFTPGVESEGTLVAGAAECAKGYGRVIFGDDGFCPVSGASVFTVPCGQCQIAPRVIATEQAVVLPRSGNGAKPPKRHG